MKKILIAIMAFGVLVGCDQVVEDTGETKESEETKQVQAEEKIGVTYKDNTELLADFLGVLSLDTDLSRKAKIEQAMFAEGAKINEEGYEYMYELSTRMMNDDDITVSTKGNHAIFHKKGMDISEVDDKNFMAMIEFTKTDKGWKIKKIYIP